MRPLRVGLIELFVPLFDTAAYKQLRGEPPARTADHVWHTLCAAPAARNTAAANAITAAYDLGVDVILCPGWTFLVHAEPPPWPERTEGGTASGVLVFETSHIGAGTSQAWVRYGDTFASMGHQIVYAADQLWDSTYARQPFRAPGDSLQRGMA